MHIFLQGHRGVGKSTVIQKTLDILAVQAPLALGGFFTWNDGRDDPHIYIRSAQSGREGEIHCLASWDMEKRVFSCDVKAFEQAAVHLLNNFKGAELIIMDELGFLESKAPNFRQSVLDTISGDIPVLGVLRLGDVPWHAEIKRNPRVTLYDVNEENRDTLPRELAAALSTAKG